MLETFHDVPLIKGFLPSLGLSAEERDDGLRVWDRPERSAVVPLRRHVLKTSAIVGSSHGRRRHDDVDHSVHSTARPHTVHFGVIGWVIDDVVILFLAEVRLRSFGRRNHGLHCCRLASLERPLTLTQFPDLSSDLCLRPLQHRHVDLPPTRTPQPFQNGSHSVLVGINTVPQSQQDLT